MFDRVGTTDLSLTCSIGATRTALADCETKRARIRNVGEAITRTLALRIVPARLDKLWTQLWTQLWTRCGVGTRSLALGRAWSPKSVATEYYRPNTEDCGGRAVCLKKRRFCTGSRAMCDLRRAGDRPMQTRHDCESEFGSTSESGRQRW